MFYSLTNKAILLSYLPIFKGFFSFLTKIDIYMVNRLINKDILILFRLPTTIYLLVPLALNKFSKLVRQPMTLLGVIGFAHGIVYISCLIHKDMGHFVQPLDLHSPFERKMYCLRLHSK